MQPQLLLQNFLERVQKHPNKPYLHQPINRELTVFTWADVNKQAQAVAGALSEQFEQGDRIAILSKNCAEWIITDLAIMMAGMISVPIYHTASKKTIEYVLGHSESKAVFIGKLDGRGELESADLSKLTSIAMPYDTVSCDKPWADYVNHAPIAEIAQLGDHDLMTISYTSGTTGSPKGVELSANNLCSTAESLASKLNLNEQDRMMSYLPLAHIMERYLIEVGSCLTGSALYFVESLDSFIDDVKVGQPTLFISVPRLWSKFQSQVLVKMPDKKLQFLLKIPVVKKLVQKKIKTALGLEHARVCASGSAPIAREILEWFYRLDIPISEGWGLTESSAGSTVNVPFDVKALGTVGKALDSCTIKLTDQGEVLLQGESVFTTYHKNPEATAESFSDGWFHTGDLGELDAHGNLKIIGRVKEQFKSERGKYVSPVPIESLLMCNHGIEQCMVFGSGRVQPIAVVVMSEGSTTETAELTASLLKTLEDTNSELEHHEHVDALIIVSDEWTPESELLTPTLKLKRAQLEKKYGHFLTEKLSAKVMWV
ncbi:MAG: AMP-binding protein [Sinobacterium sp.]|nr:AMP-binding protein [Sinobacterium sp.]